MGQTSNVLESANGLLSNARDYTEDETRPLLNGNQSHHGHGSDVIDLSGMDNSHNPMNMPAWRKWCCASVFNAAIPVTAQEFNVSPETISLATSLVVFGFAAGSVLMGLASELLGRKIPFFLGYLAFILFQIPVALAQDAETVQIFRFLGGVASAASPAIVGGYLAYRKISASASDRTAFEGWFFSSPATKGYNGKHSASSSSVTQLLRGKMFG